MESFVRREASVRPAGPAPRMAIRGMCEEDMISCSLIELWSC